MNDSKKTIVLNRMYAGSYLSTHLGHEVINMFQADNGKHYLYLNSKGNLEETGACATEMLLVMHVGGKRVEVIGLAKELKPVAGAQCSLPRNLTTINSSVSEKQREYILNEEKNKEGDEGGIHYGGVPLLDLFGTGGQQNVYVSYEVGENNFFVPNERMFLCFDKDEYREGDILLSEHNFASTSLRQFITEGSTDFEKLNSLINDSCSWHNHNEMVEVGTYTTHKTSLFDICRISYNENCFSDALAYYMEKYPKLWVDFFNGLGITLNDNFTVSREVAAKINSEKCKENTGGRIDLLLSDESSFIIIENKVKSDINKIERDLDVNQNQLDRYKNFIKYLINNNKVIQKQYFLFVLAPDYSKLSIVYEKKYKLLTYSQICNYLKDKIGVLGDDDFKAFYYAMRRNSFEHESLCLYDDMKNLFYSRIEDYHHKLNFTKLNLNTI
jgi:hypothetical protein